MTEVFISYSRKDLSFIEQLAADLENAGFFVWYDLSDLDGGDHWAKEIQAAIDSSDVFITVISPDSIVSEWVSKEFIYASSNKKRIVPLLYRKCNLPLWLSDIHFIDIQGKNYQHNFQTVLQTLDKDVSLKAKKPKPVTRKREVEWSKFKPYALAMVIGVIVLGLALNLPKVFQELTDTPTDPPTPIVQTTNAPIVSPPTNQPVDTEASPTLSLPASPTPYVDAKGVPMVLVDAGVFTVGSDSHTVKLSSFYIDTFEVTNELYQECVEADDCDPPKKLSSSTRNDYYGNSDFKDFPVIYVSWEMAKAYCSWRGARLPTDNEWEGAARGMSGQAYPWGEASPDCSKANYKGCNRGENNMDDTQNVGLSKKSKPYGLYDLAGNVWEWVNDLDPNGERVMRGGAWDRTPAAIKTTIRSTADLSNSNNMDNYGSLIGFRCAKDANP